MRPDSAYSTYSIQIPIEASRIHNMLSSRLPPAAGIVRCIRRRRSTRPSVCPTPPLKKFSDQCSKIRPTACPDSLDNRPRARCSFVDSCKVVPLCPCALARVNPKGQMSVERRSRSERRSRGISDERVASRGTSADHEISQVGSG